MSDLHGALALCLARLRRYRGNGQRIGEQNTKASLIEPVIAALGWEVVDPDEVHREYRRRSADNPVDYALLLLRAPKLFIEAKGLGENLDDPRWANQTISYAAVAGVEWVALTDGAEWRVYNAHAPVPIEQKLLRAVKLEDGLDTAVALLSLLGKESIRENRLEELWKVQFVDRQVKAELRSLFGGDPAPELVTLLAGRLSKLTREQIHESLGRGRATFDFPSTSVALPQPSNAKPLLDAAQPLGRAPQDPVAETPEPPKQKLPRIGLVTPGERLVSVNALLTSGRIAPGRLVADYLRQQIEAEILADGSVRYAGEVYSSLSAAGVAVKRALRGVDAPTSVTATDGWEFWKARDVKAGDVVTLKEIRRREARESTT